MRRISIWGSDILAKEFVDSYDCTDLCNPTWSVKIEIDLNGSISCLATVMESEFRVTNC